MANRAYLVLNRSGDPNADVDERDIAAGASYYYPILWCGIFSLNDLITTVCPAEPETDEEEINPKCLSYLTLLTPLATAKERAIQRRDQFFSWFPRTVEPFYRQWLDLLDGVDAPYIQLETAEIWFMSDDERSERELRSYIRAFEENRLDDWVALLRQAQIEFDGEKKKVAYNPGNEEEGELMGYRLRGYQWLRDVPWKD